MYDRNRSSGDKEQEHELCFAKFFRGFLCTEPNVRVTVN